MLSPQLPIYFLQFIRVISPHLAIIIGAAYPVGSMGIFTYMQNLDFMVKIIRQTYRSQEFYGNRRENHLFSINVYILILM